MRLANALKKRFRELGGLLLEVDEVLPSEFKDGHLVSIKTRLNPHMPLEADYFSLGQYL